jgi:hypothetical protein
MEISKLPVPREVKLNFNRDAILENIPMKYSMFGPLAIFPFEKSITSLSQWETLDGVEFSLCKLFVDAVNKVIRYKDMKTTLTGNFIIYEIIIPDSKK